MMRLAFLTFVVAISAVLAGCEKKEFSKEIDLVKSKANPRCKEFPWKAKRMEKYGGKVAVWYSMWGFLVNGDSACAVNGASRACADVPDCPEVTGNPEDLFR